MIWRNHLTLFSIILNVDLMTTKRVSVQFNCHFRKCIPLNSLKLIYQSSFTLSWGKRLTANNYSWDAFFLDTCMLFSIIGWKSQESWGGERDGFVRGLDKQYMMKSAKRKVGSSLNRRWLLHRHAGKSEKWINVFKLI